MGLEFITRIIKTTAILALVAALATSVYFDWVFALGLLIGSVWGLVNLYFLKKIITEAISPGETRTGSVVLLILVKFPLLYIGGYFIVAWNFFPVYSLLAGFSLMFVVMVLKILGRMILGLDMPGFTPRAHEPAEGKH